MKTKYISLIAFFVMAALTGCDPMEDIKSDLEIDEAYNKKVANFKYDRELAPQAYTLTDDDYALSSNENVQKYKNFSESVLPKDFLPEILNTRFYGEPDQEMAVTYAFYSSVNVDEENAYELTDEDYESIGQGYGNFDDEDDVAYKLPIFLAEKNKFEEVEAGTEETIMYEFYSRANTRYIEVTATGETTVLEDADEATPLDSATYDLLGFGKYYNFSYISEAEEGVAKLVTDHDSTAKVYSCLVYSNYYDQYFVGRYDGDMWSEATSVANVTEALSYIENTDDFTLSVWEADNAIKVTLTSADYALFDATASYSNFDLRDGKTPGTNQALMIEMIGTMLETNHNAADDQPYIVTYTYYDGGSGVSKIRIIKTDGVWVVHEK